MANAPTPGPLEIARCRLLARIGELRLSIVPGLREDLSALVDALDELDRRTCALAAFALTKHYWPDSPVHSAEMKALAEMGEHAATRYRVAHETGCLCAECFPPARVDYGNATNGNR